MTTFYVYVYKDPRPSKQQRPVYVGKGTGDRDLSHWSRGSHNKPLQDFLSHLRGVGMVPICVRVFETEDEQEAFNKEIELIKLYGRKDLGTGGLFNRTDGGEGATGHVRTEAQKKEDGRFSTEHWRKPEYRAKVVAAQTKAQNTPEALAAKSENSKKLWETESNRLAKAIKSARSTDTSKAKTSKQAKAQWADPEYAAMQTANNKEIANRADVKAAKAAALKARWADPAFKAMMLAARRKNVDTKK